MIAVKEVAVQVKYVDSGAKSIIKMFTIPNEYKFE